MKRPMTLVLVASLLVSGSALAAVNGNAMRDKIATAVVRNDDAKRGNDNRGNDNRGRDNRGGDNRGGNSQRNNNERDRNNHAPPSYSGGQDRRNDHRDDGKDRGHNNGPRHDNDRDDRNGHDRRNDHNRNSYNTRNNWNGHRGWDRPRSDWNKHPNYWDNRRHDRRDYARYRYNYGHYRAPHGYHYRVWHRGDYLPRAYYGSSYIVYDWRPYRLYAPPYGYHWVRVGNDVLLTALATGVVLDVLYGIWY